jgi:hypothetical protein
MTDSMVPRNDGTLRRHNDDRGTWMLLLHLLDQPESIGARHSNVD